MGRRSIAVELAAFVLASAAASGQALKPEARFHQEASSTAESWREKDGRWMSRTVNRRFTFATVHPERYREERLLLAETFDRLLDSGAEGEKSTVTVEATRVGAGGGKAAWRFQAEGASGEPEDNLYRVVRPGCCGARDATTYFSLVNGRELFTADIPILKLEVPNSPLRRFVGYEDGMSARPIPEAASDGHLIGVLSYGSDREGAARILVDTSAGDSSDARYAATKLSFVSGGKEVESEQFDLWAADKTADPAKIGGFSIRVRAYTTPDVLCEIPVAGDRFDLLAARCAKGILLKKAG